MLVNQHMITQNTDKVSFSGKYRAYAENLANNAMNYFGCSVAQAQRLGDAFMADWGKLVSKQDSEFKTIIGSISTNGDVSGRDIETVTRSGKASPAISIAKLVVEVEKCRKYGMLFKDTSIGMVSTLNDWLFQSGVWAKSTPVEATVNA